MATNPWKYVKVNDDGTNPYLYPKAEPVRDTLPIIAPAPPATSTVFTGEYILMPQTRTYALGVHALQEACIAENNQNQPKVVINGREIYRPNTFLENILARINYFNTEEDPDGTPRTMEERLKFLEPALASCCGATYKAKTTKLKFNLLCSELIAIPKEFADGFLPVDYASFQGIELDSASKNFVRDAWMILFEGRDHVYTEYLTMIRAAKGAKIVPNFWKWQDATDKLQAVCISTIGKSSCYADGIYFFSGQGCFLHCKPPKLSAQSARKRKKWSVH